MFRTFLLLLFLSLANEGLCNLEYLDIGHRARDPDEGRTPEQLITSRGYKPETHYMTTEDGYILTVHRIINPLNTRKNLRPILLQHGLLCSSITFLNNAPGGDAAVYDLKDLDNIQISNNLGFALSQFGFDVWLGNSRGNLYSLNHTKLNPSRDKAFWKFSFDEMIKYDLPATISYILDHANATKLGYIGHSQGTLIMFGLLSLQPEYSKIIDPFIALAPVTTVNHVLSPIRYLAYNAPLVNFFYYYGGNFLPSNALLKKISDIFCNSEAKFLCSNIVFLLCGYDLPQLNRTRDAVYDVPGGTSAWNMVHFAQMVKSGRFQMMDHGKRGNLERYGTAQPPDYPLDMINSQTIAMMSSKNDWLADTVDVDGLRKALKVPLLSDYTVPYETWNHLDFIWALDSGRLVNRKALELLRDN